MKSEIGAMNLHSRKCQRLPEIHQKQEDCLQDSFVDIMDFQSQDLLWLQNYSDSDAFSVHQPL